MRVGESRLFSEAKDTLATISGHLLHLEARLTKPFWILDKNNVQGARYSNPNINHFFLLSMGKVISGLNAVIVLLEKGFLYEHGLIVRSVLEAESKLSYVMAGVGPDKMDTVSTKFLEEFLSDNERSPDDRKRYTPLRQVDVHKRASSAVSKAIQKNKEFGLAVELSNDNDEVTKLHSHLYNLYSNYVHGRYPESMDLFDQNNREFRLNGGVRERDIELEAELLATLADSASKRFRGDYLTLVSFDPLLIEESVLSYAMGPDFESMIQAMARNLRARAR